jgi:hypothetical protein
MDMGVETTGSNNAMFARNHICAIPDYKVRIHAIHHVRISRFAYAHDHAIFDTNVGLVDPGPVDNQSVGDHGIQAFFVGPSTCLTHTFSQGLAASKGTFIAVPRHIFFYLDP